ncbi:type II toxin-antitoxin system mRNA interferase toxin, RelE/StbE family [Candidatus Peregrinibacteria bacterium]|nr:MAG: type II toxin-antitoxin system mRNA interferase toxin, RelE/StbE family [Candidatus Peregrinibacteria bacterium]
MQKYTLLFTKQALKDIKKLQPKENQKLQDILLNVIAIHPQSGKKLLGNLKNNYSYRLSIKNRIIYSLDEKNSIIYIKRTRTHYGE